MNLKWMSKAFKKVCGLHGGETGLEAILKRIGARSVTQQAVIVSDLAAGVKVSELKLPAERKLGFSGDELEAAKTKLAGLMGGKPKLLEYLKANHALHVRKQWEFVTAELARRGAAATPSVAPAKPTATKPTVTAPAAPKLQIAASKPPVTEGRLDLATARERTREVFGHAPAVIPGQSERSQWAELTAMYRQHGHSAPWDDSGAPSSIVMGLHRSDGGWRKREAAIAKAFPGCAPTTARHVERKPEPQKPVTGRERFVRSIKIN